VIQIANGYFQVAFDNSCELPIFRNAVTESVIQIHHVRLLIDAIAEKQR
jgi:hypothetical protein